MQDVKGKRKYCNFAAWKR